MASNAETNIAKALELKAQGNEAFKAADYKQAMVHYHQVHHARRTPPLAPAASARRTAPPPWRWRSSPGSLACHRATPAPRRAWACRACHTRAAAAPAHPGQLHPPTRARVRACRSTCTCTASPRAAARVAGSRCQGRRPSRRRFARPPPPAPRLPPALQSRLPPAPPLRPSPPPCAGEPGDDGTDQGAQGRPLLQPGHVSHEAGTRPEGTLPSCHPSRPCVT
eukprot:scaffold92437_cov36-Phaeocystis_antarctica.AAC.1